MKKTIIISMFVLTLGLFLNLGVARADDDSSQTREREQACKVVLTETGQKQVMCQGETADLKTLMAPLPLKEETKERIQNLVPSFKAVPLRASGTDISSTTKPAPENLGQMVSATVRERNEMEWEERKQALEDFKDNLEQNREMLKEEFEQKRETLRAEVEARGENGLAEIVQDPEKRILIQDLQLKKLRIQLTESLERTAHLADRLSDISERIEERITILQESGSDTTVAESLLNEVASMLQTLDGQIETGTEAINNAETIEDLKQIGKDTMTEIKGTLESVKAQIGKTIENLKGLVVPTTETDES